MKNVMKVAVFTGILVFLLLGFYRIFRFKYTDGIYSMDAFHALEDNSLDVLVLGSSHAFEDINPAVLWEEQGIAAFDLCGSIQPVWNTYFFLKEALETQNPKVVILEGYCLSLDLDYIDEGRIVKNYYGLSMSLNKIQAGMESVPREQWKEYLPEWIRYHNRYQELERSDFLDYLGQTNYYKNWKGFGSNCGYLESASVENFYTEETVPLHEKTEKYYRKILELGQEKGIQLLVVISPYAGISREAFAKYNRAEEIAGEYGVPFINYNTMVEEIGLDYTQDIPDMEHLNHQGSTKFTSFLGNFLKENYELPDHRGEEAYISWDINALCTDQEVYNQRLSEVYSLENYIRKLNQGSYTVMLSVTGELNEEKEGKLVRVLADFGIDEETCRQGGTWVKQGEEFIYYSGGESEYLWHQEVSTGDLAVKGISETEAELYWREQKQNKVETGINILVYDSITEMLVDAVGFDAARDWQGVR